MKRNENRWTDETCEWCRGSTERPEKPRRRKTKRVVISEYQFVMRELLRIKQEFLARNPEYAEELQTLSEELPSGGDTRDWADADRQRLQDFIHKWDLAPVGFPTIREHPYGPPNVSWDEGYGVLELSDHKSDLLVLGIDIRHDVTQVLEKIKDLIFEVRHHRQNAGEEEHRWKTLRAHDTTRRKKKDAKRRRALGVPEHAIILREYLITDFMQECYEAIRAWDLDREGMSDRSIRDALFPEAADIAPEQAGEVDFDDEADPESALRLTERRLSLARHMVFHEGYREILPLTGYRSQCDAFAQWLSSSGLTHEQPTP